MIFEVVNYNVVICNVLICELWQARPFSITRYCDLSRRAQAHARAHTLFPLCAGLPGGSSGHLNGGSGIKTPPGLKRNFFSEPPI